MHRSLAISEIIDLIFAELQRPDYERNLGHKDFAALARTCKNFQNPALDHLWREQDTLTNLLKCLPSHLWEEKVDPAVSGSRGTFRITGPVSTSDWNIPFAYALRIRRLELHSWGITSPVADVFERISTALARDHLCPNLETLSFQIYEDRLFPYIRLFLGPKVIDTTICLPFSHASSLPDLPLRCSDLKRLAIDTFTSEGNTMLLRVVSNLVSRLERIEDLTLAKLSREALEHLPRLPSLRSLHLQRPLLEDIASFPQCRTSPRTPFPALRELYFGDTTIEFALGFLNLLSDCSLETFSFGTTVAATRFETGQLYATLTRRLSHTSLRTLYVEVAEDQEMPAPAGPIANYVINRDILAMLFCFSNLTTLALTPPVGFDIDDATAWDIARAWPKLEVLCLDAATELHHSSRISLGGLCAFAKHCKDLTNLTITFDASSVPPLGNSTENVISQSSLVFLGTNKSQIIDPVAVASFLSKLFPHLSVIHTYLNWFWEEPADEDEDDETANARLFNSRWKQVESMLADLKN
ncbi:hypothetical protein MVEN_00977900 [Mycena venus]|uniref:F-box domain-containing protein n=1 Tax=Mycena venus TaxID=2733690 RepID=A0A8H6Y8S8_9AGAR|nr:hypothetical protein MVEN_00977900 [Mycena venus]